MMFCCSVQCLVSSRSQRWMIIALAIGVNSAWLKITLMNTASSFRWWSARRSYWSHSVYSYTPFRMRAHCWLKSNEKSWKWNANRRQIKQRKRTTPSPNHWMKLPVYLLVQSSEKWSQGKRSKWSTPYLPKCSCSIVNVHTTAVSNYYPLHVR